MSEDAVAVQTVHVRIPAQIRRLYGASAQEQVQAATVRAVVQALDARFPGMGERLMEPGGHMRRWVNIYVDGEDIREKNGAETMLRAGCEVIIVPSIAGGNNEKNTATGTS
jgi:molybdopterin synthase sulfur carrier subunit